jgi:hypothetical protein
MDWTNFTHKEPITRFIYSKRHFSIEKRTISTAAFDPKPNSELSVFRTRRLSQLQIWNLAEKHISPLRQPQRLKARGDLSISNVLNINLVFNPDTESHKRHAVILGWPDSRDEILELAAELANMALLYLYESDSG